LNLKNIFVLLAAEEGGEAWKYSLRVCMEILNYKYHIATMNSVVFLALYGMFISKSLPGISIDFESRTDFNAQREHGTDTTR
jgi:hypothetical protein